MWIGTGYVRVVDATLHVHFVRRGSIWRLDHQVLFGGRVDGGRCRSRGVLLLGRSLRVASGFWCILEVCVFREPRVKQGQVRKKKLAVDVDRQFSSRPCFTDL